MSWSGSAALKISTPFFRLQCQKFRVALREAQGLQEAARALFKVQTELSTTWVVRISPFLLRRTNRKIASGLFFHSSVSPLKHHSYQEQGHSTHFSSVFIQTKPNHIKEGKSDIWLTMKDIKFSYPNSFHGQDYWETQYIIESPNYSHKNSTHGTPMSCKVAEKFLFQLHLGHLCKLLCDDLICFRFACCVIVCGDANATVVIRNMDMIDLISVWQYGILNMVCG